MAQTTQKSPSTAARDTRRVDDPATAISPFEAGEARALPPRSANACLCTVCGRVLLNERDFDLHRVGPHDPPGRRRCLTPAEMRAKGLVLDERGVWRSPKRPAPARQSERR